jgi:hypothetical protein
MIQTNQPESAFPSTFRSLSGPDGEQQVHRWGMQLRDYFAAKAMQVMMAETNGEGDDNPGSPRWDPEEVTNLSYNQADAMLRAREAS